MNNHKAMKNDVTIQLIVVYHRSHVSIRYLTRISLKTFQGFVFSGKVNLLHIVGRSLWNKYYAADKKTELFRLEIIVFPLANGIFK